MGFWGFGVLLRLDQVKRVHVSLYNELAVVKIWPMMQSDEQIMRYFPDKLPKGRVPDRSYFFDIVHTFQQRYLKALIKHANNNATRQ